MGRYDGDESYRKLISNVYGANDKSIVQKYKDYSAEIQINEILMQILMLFTRSGYYTYSSGINSSRGYSGNLWEIRTSIDASYRLGFNAIYLGVWGSNEKGNGFSVRCVAKFL